MSELNAQQDLHTRMYDSFIWGLKYRPKHIDELILPDRITNHLRNIIKDKRLPNMLLSGPAGTGKTSTAIVLAGMLDLEYLYINASEQTGIDVLRTNVRQFITNVSWDGTGKVVILDEFDRASPQFQDALKSTLEQFSKSCSFVFISNHKNKIIPPLQSRLQTVEFKFTNAENNQLKKEFFKSCIRILKTEKVQYSDKVVAQIVKNIFPDMRKILNELQKLASQECLDSMDTVASIGSDVESYFKIIKQCKFKDLLKYIAQLPGDPQGFYSQLYESALKYVEGDSVPDFVVLLGKYSYESSFVVDSRINLTAFSTEVMKNCKMKEDLDG
jgi:DNA polymerase III delta prime subunit